MLRAVLTGRPPGPSAFNVGSEVPDSVVTLEGYTLYPLGHLPSFFKTWHIFNKYFYQFTPYFFPHHYSLHLGCWLLFTNKHQGTRFHPDTSLLILSVSDSASLIIFQQGAMAAPLWKSLEYLAVLI